MSLTSMYLNICITNADAKGEGNGDELVFTIQTNLSLRNMIRAIVGTIMEIGSKKLDMKDMKRIIEAKYCSGAGYRTSIHSTPNLNHICC